MRIVATIFLARLITFPTPRTCAERGRAVVRGKLFGAMVCVGKRAVIPIEMSKP